jgi:hypothetical protein
VRRRAGVVTAVVDFADLTALAGAGEGVLVAVLDGAPNEDDLVDDGGRAR